MDHELLINDPSHFLRHHRVASHGVPVSFGVCSHIVFGDIQILDSGGATSAGLQQRCKRLRLRHGLQILQVTGQDLDVHRVAEVPRINDRLDGPVLGADVDATAGKGI